MDAETKAELADVYEKAAEYLEEHGWCGPGEFNSFSGSMGDGNPSCMAIAISQFSQQTDGRVSPLEETAWNFAANALELNSDDGFGAVLRWNDTPGRTADEVINTLHALANKLR